MNKISRIKLNPPQIPYLSNITGKWITAAEATSPEYWARLLRNTISFDEGLTQLLKLGRIVLIEVGGGRTLTDLTKQHPAYRPADHLTFNPLAGSPEPMPDLYQLLTMLGTLWGNGVNIDWAEFYRLERRRRISLPTYPFERQRFWIDGIPSQAPVAQPATPSVLKKNAMNQWFYIPSWEKTPPIVWDGPDIETGSAKRCLIFLGDHRFSANLVTQLQARGVAPVIVKPGREFKVLETGQYIVNPHHESDYEALILELKIANRLPELVIHLWNITGDEPSAAPEELHVELMDTGFYSLLYLAKAVTQENYDKLQIMVVADNTQMMADNEQISAEKAATLGPCKVIPQEFPGITCKFIDLRLPEPESRLEDILLGNLVKEFFTPASEPVIAYRGSYRWAQVFKPVQSQSYKTNIGLTAYHSAVLKERGIYLITGGLGRIGMQLAGTLAETLQAKIILIGHSPFPDKTAWQQWLASHEPDEINCRRIRKLKELEALGAEVFVFTSDLSNPRQLEEIIVRVEKRLGRINGVIHAAAVLGGKMIQELTESDCETYFQAKMRGLLTLYQVFQNRELDFGLLMSSLASILGGIGLTAYTAANLFLDALAQQISSGVKTRWVSVNWDGWEFPVEKPAASIRTAKLDSLAITPEEGIRAFYRVLELEGLNQVVISTGNLHDRIDQWIKLGSLKQATGSENLKIPLYPRPDLSNPYLAPRNPMEIKLAGIWQEVLGFERAGINDHFFDLGGDSLKAIQISEKAKQQGLNLSVKDILSFNTIERICGNIDQAAVTNPAAATEEEQELAFKGYHLFYHVKSSSPVETEATGTKILQIALQNEITSYLNHALPLCVILADHRLLPWFYEHYIDIYGIIDESGYLRLEFLEFWASYREVVEQTYFGYDFLDPATDIIDFVIHKINLGFYVIIHADEYYLPVKSHYQKVHFVHQSIIYGYDNNDQNFMAIGFNRDQLFTKITFEYDRFREAFAKGKIYYPSSAPWAENNVIELLKFNDHIETYPFDIRKFNLKLEKYLLAAGDPSVPFSAMINRQNVRYGFKVFDEVIRCLENALEGQFTMDYQTIHFLAEHKKGIFNRLQYIAAQYPITGSLGKMIDEYRQIAGQFESIRIKFLELQYSNDLSGFQILPTVIRETIDLFKAMKEKERILLSGISKQLKAL